MFRDLALNGAFISASSSQVHLLTGEFGVRGGRAAADVQINAAGLILLTVPGKPLEFKPRPRAAF